MKTRVLYSLFFDDTSCQLFIIQDNLPRKIIVLIKQGSQFAITSIESFFIFMILR